MTNKFVKTISEYKNSKDLLTLWMNNLVVLYAFMLPISQTIKATVFSFIVILFLIRGNIVENIKLSLSNKVVRAFLYLFIIYVIGLLWSQNIPSGISAVKSIKYGLYLIIFYSIMDGRYINRVITAFILGMLVSELTSYGMLFGVMPWKLEFGGILFYKAFAVGDPAPFLHHIHYGVALSLTLFLLGQKIFFSSANIWAKIGMGIFMLTATANIFITGGRTGYMTLIFLVLILSIFYLKKYAVVAILLLSLVLLTAYKSSDIFQNKFEQTEKSIEKLFKNDPNYNTSLGIRVGIYNYAIEVIKNNPLLGVGTGDSMDEIYKITPDKWIGIHSAEHEHNQFLSLFVKLGIVGVLIFLNLFYQIFNYKQDDKYLKFIMIFSTLAIGFGTLTTQFNLRFFMPLWVIMLAITLISKDRKTVINMPLIDKKQTLQIVAVGIVFSASSLLNQLL